MWKFLCFLPVSGWAIWENKPEKLASYSSKLEKNSLVKCKMFILFFKYPLDGEELVEEGEGKTMLNTRGIWGLDILQVYTYSTWVIQQIDGNLIFHTETFDYYMEIVFTQKLFMREIPSWSILTLSFEREISDFTSWLGLCTKIIFIYNGHFMTRKMTHEALRAG